MMNNILEMLIRRSRGVQPTPPAPSIPEEEYLVVDAELATDTTPTVGTFVSKGNAYTFTSLDGVNVMQSEAGNSTTGVWYTPLRSITGATERTFSLWLYPTNYSYIENWIYSGGGRNMGDIVCMTARSDRQKLHFAWGEGWQGALNQIAYPPLNQWTHVVFTYDGSYGKVYYNGVLMGTSNSSTLSTTNTNLSITGGDVTWGCCFRNYKVWDTALTGDEVSDLYGLELPIFEGQASDSSSSGDVSDSSSSGDISDSSSSGGGDPSLLWYTPFASDYEEKVSGITGRPTENGICEIVSDSRFGGYLNMHKYFGGNLTGLQFAGTQNALQLGTGDWSMSFWLNAPAWNDYGQAIISHRGNGTGFDNKDGFVLFKDSSTYMDMRIGSSSNQATSSAIPTDDTWHNWVFVHYSDGEWEWYMDGEYAEGGSGWGGDATSNGNVNVFIGGDGDWGKSAVFKLCHLRIYNRYLEYEEIEDMYHEFDESSDSSESSDPDLVFHAPLSTDFNDHSASARQATMVMYSGSQASPSLETKDGYACTYIPHYSKLSYPQGDINVGNTPRTFAIWVYRSSESYTGWSSYLFSGNNTNYEMFCVGENNAKAAFLGYFNDVISSTTIASEWTHVCVTYDLTAVKVYVNGTVVATDQQSDKMATANGDIFIGGRNGDSSSSDLWANGAWFRDARIYNRALTDAEILTIYQEGL